MAEVKQVYIPAKPDHDGLCGVSVRLNWECPVCGGKRGETAKCRSYDGSRYLDCDGWANPCGHIDKYTACIQEAVDNGLNLDLRCVV